MKRLEAFYGSPNVNELIALGDSYKRWVNFQRLCNSHEKLKAQNGIGDFQVEILKPRNFLAHAKPLLEDGVYIFKYRDEEYRFDENVSIELRKTIIRYKENFTEIIGILRE